MAAANVVPLLLSLFALLGVGLALRAFKVLPASATDVINLLIVDVTMPALIVQTLRRASFDARMGPAVAAVAAALLVSLAVSVLVTRAFGLSRKVQGAAGLVGGFSNTGFLGLPFVLSLYPSRPQAAATAVVIDAVVTTTLLWTLGVGFASWMSGAPRVDEPRSRRLWRTVRKLVVKPLVLAVMLGALLSVTGAELPGFVDAALDRAGEATAALVFLSLGMSLDVAAVRGRVLALASISVVKLLLAPLVALGVVLALGVSGEIGEVAVLQAAMPTAMVSAIIAYTYGCDRGFAAGTAVTTTLGSLVSLPVVVVVLERVGL